MRSKGLYHYGWRFLFHVSNGEFFTKGVMYKTTVVYKNKEEKNLL